MILNDNSIIHCFFEQSGIFKTQFKKLGYAAYDYDILNDFNQTDFKTDLFNEINCAYNGTLSLFDTIDKNDLIIAFFPCVRFTNRMLFNFTNNHINGHTYFNDIEMLEQNIKFFNEMNYYYTLISKLVIVCIRRNLKLIIENPYHPNHILTKFWHLKPSIIDKDRSLRGDYYKKPTQYWFINCRPHENYLLEPLIYNPIKTINSVSNKVERSLISSDYAERFIKEFIL